MSKVRWAFLLTVVAVALVAWIAALGADSVWVSSDGKTHDIHGSGHVVLFDDGAALDLSELADGETRVIGAGDSAITVSRSGDVATISRAAVGDRQALDVRCDLTRDSCKVKVLAEDPERVMVMVRRERECVNGEGDCEEPLELEGLGGDGQRIMIRKVLHCDGEEDCEKIEGAAAGAHELHIEASAGEGAEGHVMFLRSGGAEDVIVVPQGDSVVLRCPEGDATLRVSRAEAGQTFLCPKHATPLTRVEPRVGVRELRLPKRAETH